MSLERRQPERIPTILHSEDTHEETIHAEENAAPNDNGQLLGSSVFYPGYFERERDSGEREKSVWDTMLAGMYT